MICYRSEVCLPGRTYTTPYHILCSTRPSWTAVVAPLTSWVQTGKRNIGGEGGLLRFRLGGVRGVRGDLSRPVLVGWHDSIMQLHLCGWLSAAGGGWRALGKKVSL